MKYPETASRVELDAVCQRRDTAHGRGTPFERASLSSVKRAESDPAQVCFTAPEKVHLAKKVLKVFRTRTL